MHGRNQEDFSELDYQVIREAKVAQMYSAIQTGRKEGMQTLDQHLQELVEKGVVARQVARTKAVNKTAF